MASQCYGFCSRTRSTVALAAAITAVRATAVLRRGLIYSLNRLALRCWRLLPPSRRATVAMPHRTKGWPARATTTPRHGLTSTFEPPGSPLPASRACRRSRCCPASAAASSFLSSRGTASCGCSSPVASPLPPFLLPSRACSLSRCCSASATSSSRLARHVGPLHLAALLAWRAPRLYLHRRGGRAVSLVVAEHPAAN